MKNRRVRLSPVGRAAPRVGRRTGTQPANFLCHSLDLHAHPRAPNWCDQVRLGRTSTGIQAESPNPKNQPPGWHSVRFLISNLQFSIGPTPRASNLPQIGATGSDWLGLARFFPILHPSLCLLHSPFRSAPRSSIGTPHRPPNGRPAPIRHSSQILHHFTCQRTSGGHNSTAAGRRLRNAATACC